MKRLTALLLTLLMCVACTGCGAKWIKHKSYTVDLIVKGSEVDFWKSVNEGAQAAASLYHMDVNYCGPAQEETGIEQIRLLREAVARRPDAIILAASDYTLLAQPVQEAIDAGIPVLMVDSDVDNPNTQAYIGTDNVELGTQLAQRLCQRAHGGEIGVVSFMKDSYTAMQREQGFRAAAAQAEGFTLLDTVYCDSDIQQAKALTLELLKTHPAMTALAALNAPSAQGAARALEESGRTDVALFAIDCVPEAAMYMEDGVLQLALLQNPYQMGYYSVEAAYRCLRGEKVEDISTDIYPVDIATLFDERYQQLIFPFAS